MSPTNHDVRRKPLVIWRAIASAVLLAAAVFLWFWTAGVYYRPLPRLGIGVAALEWRFSAIASDDGVHFGLAQGSGNQLEFRWRGFNRPSYHHGLVANLLGVIVAVQPYTYNGGDYFVSPNAGIVLPYWFLIVASTYGVMRWTGVAGWLAPYCHFGKAAWGVMLATGLAFLALNITPYKNPLAGSSYDPGKSTAQYIDEWATFTFAPASLGDIEQHYGFPFCYREVGYKGGQRVELYYGAEMHFRQHKLAENHCLALGTMLARGIVVQWRSGLREPLPNSRDS
jgi:hypothetical protein